MAQCAGELAKNFDQLDERVQLDFLAKVGLIFVSRAVLKTSSSHLGPQVVPKCSEDVRDKVLLKQLTSAPPPSSPS